MVGKKLYVGVLAVSTTDYQLNEMFSAHGTVESARVMSETVTSKSRGFGFVEMGSQSEAQRAIQVLHESRREGQRLTVGEARGFRYL